MGELWQDLRRDVSEPVMVLVVLAPLLEIVARYEFRPSDFRRHFHARWGREPWFELGAFAWWYLGTALLYFIVPATLWWLRYRQSPRQYGLRWGHRRWGLLVALAWVGMALILIPASADPTFARKYPLFAGARERWDLFLIYQVLYGVYFWAFEYHFRGWALRTLAETFGTAAIWLQTWPYLLVKLGKPLPEVVAAVPAGLFLGWMAWRSGSFLYGWLLHWGVAVFLDFLVVLRFPK